MPGLRNALAVGASGSCASGPVTGFRSGRMRKNCSRSMKNGSSRQPANTCTPSEVPSTVLILPVTVDATSATWLPIAPGTGGATGPRTSTVWSAPDPLNVIWMTLSSTPSVLLSSLKSSMVSSAVGLPTYGGEPRSDCVYGRLDPLPGAHEERLLRGLRRAARGLFRHRAQIGPQSGGRRKRDDSPAAGRGVERADAHRILALLDGPELVDPARRSGREVERRHDDEATHPVPVKPHGGCLAGGGEIRGADRGIEDRCHHPVCAVELSLHRRDGAAKPVSLGPAAPIPIPRHDGERDRCGRGDPGEARRTSGAERPNLPGFAQYAVAQTRRGRRRRGGARHGLRHFAERRDVGAACRALGEVGPERGALLRFRR